MEDLGAANAQSRGPHGDGGGKGGGGSRRPEESGLVNNASALA